MRKLGHLDSESSARLFSDVLHTQGIAHELRSEGDEGHTLWVLEERQVEEARSLFARFNADPGDPDFQQAAREARGLRKAEARAAPTRHKVVDARASFQRETPRGPVTSGLIAISVMVALVNEFRPDPALRSFLSIAAMHSDGTHFAWLTGFADVRAGQVWRLVTPIFLHSDFMHLLFNMWWLLDFGTVLEHRTGSWKFLGLVLLSAALSNAAQLQWGGHPQFGGMSGVVYALFGYLWIRGKQDPSFGVALRPQLAGFFLIWWALGVTGVLDTLVGPIANYCHSGGLAVGTAWGYLASRPRAKPRLP